MWRLWSEQFVSSVSCFTMGMEMRWDLGVLSWEVLMFAHACLKMSLKINSDRYEGSWLCSWMCHVIIKLIFHSLPAPPIFSLFISLNMHMICWSQKAEYSVDKKLLVHLVWVKVCTSPLLPLLGLLILQRGENVVSVLLKVYCCSFRWFPVDSKCSLFLWRCAVSALSETKTLPKSSFILMD